MTAAVFERFVERHGDRAAEAVWKAALAMLEDAAGQGREAKWSRWAYYPRGELRRLRRDIAAALELARVAVLLQEEDNEQRRELTADLAVAAVDAGRRRRRSQTSEAQRVRLIKQRARREGREATSEEIYGPGGYLHPSDPLPT